MFKFIISTGAAVELFKRGLQYNIYYLIMQGRKFGERQARADNRYGNDSSNRYGRSNNDYDYGNEYDESSSRPKSRYISLKKYKKVIVFHSRTFYDILTAYYVFIFMIAKP